MIETSKQIILLVGLFTPSESFLDDIANAYTGITSPLSECILPNTWTQWVEHGTCGEGTRTRSYKYYMGEYEIS